MKQRLLVVTSLMLALAALAVVLLTQAGASKAATTVGMARVRVIHAAPDAPTVDVLVNGGDVFTDTMYGAVTDYISVPEGTYTVTLEPAAGGGAVYTQTLMVMGGNDYTVAAAGTLTTTDLFTFTLMAFIDDNQVPGVGQARARFVHLSPGAPAVDIAVVGGPVLFSNIAFGEASVYAEIPMGSYDLEVQITGVGTPVLSTTAVVDPNSIYSFFAIGYPVATGPRPLMAVPSLDAQYARVRAFHGIADGPPVDVQVNGAPAFVNAAFQDMTDYAALMPGSYTVGIAPTGVMTPVLTQTLVLTGGMDFTVAAAGTLATDPYPAEFVPYMDDNSEPAAGKAHIRFIHLVPGAPAVTVSVQAGPTLFTDIAYKEASAYAPVDAQTYDLEASIPGVGTLPFNDLRLLEGVVYDAIAVGDATTLDIDLVLTPDYRLWLPLIARDA